MTHPDPLTAEQWASLTPQQQLDAYRAARAPAPSDCTCGPDVTDQHELDCPALRAAAPSDHCEVHIVRDEDCQACRSYRAAAPSDGLREAAQALVDEWDMWADTHPLATHYRAQAEARLRAALATTEQREGLDVERLRALPGELEDGLVSRGEAADIIRAALREAGA